VPLDGFGVTRAMSAELLLVRDGGARPAPERLHLCRFSDACNETQPYSGAGVWKPTGKEPADVEHPKVREIL
jgi:hypothetical protein